MLLIINKIIIPAIYVFLIIPTIFFLLYLFTNELNKIYSNYLVGKGSRWYQKLFIFPAMLLGYLRGRHYILRHSKNGLEKNYIAIIRANNYFPENIFPIFGDNEKMLIKYLYKTNKNYRVFEKISRNKLLELFKDKNVSSLIIFGHGEKHGIKLEKDEVFYYCDLPKNIPKKHLIAQFHCNHHNGKSILDYGVKAKYVLINKKMQNGFDVGKQVEKIIKEKLI